MADKNLRPDKFASSFALTSSAISLCANVYIIIILVPDIVVVSVKKSARQLV
jgi:hypothetical protein